ncbi:MAG: sensor histidine kinase [Motilibacteraceae bacterium]
MRPGRWSLARQLLALQVLLLVLVLLAAALAATLQAQSRTTNRVRDEVLVLSRTLAVSPQVSAAATSADPPAVLQPYAERVRRDTGVDFVVFMAPDRTRWSHPVPSRIGEPFIGTIAPALAGRAFTETYTGTLGPSVRAVAPIRDAGGQIVGLVSVGITTASIHQQLLHQLPLLGGALLLLLLVAVAGAVLVSRRLRRQTRGLTPVEMGRMLEHHDAVLHAVREGVVVLDRDRTVALLNDGARRLLGLPAAPAGTDRDPVLGRLVADLGLPDALASSLEQGRAMDDELHPAAGRVLVVNQSDAVWEGRVLGTVATLRDRTELQELTGELDSTRAFAESLRSQAHESANRLHTVVALVETGRYEQAVEFATAELELSQALADQLLDDVDEPVLAALLLSKAAQAHERGVELVVEQHGQRRGHDIGERVPARDLVTVVGNLVDNAVDAVLETPPPRKVHVLIERDEAAVRVRVRDTGPGLSPQQLDRALQRGWSTKPAAGAAGNRGLGLSLVQEVLRRHGGRLEVAPAGPDDVGASLLAVLPFAARDSYGASEPAR